MRTRDVASQAGARQAGLQTPRAHEATGTGGNSMVQVLEIEHHMRLVSAGHNGRAR